MYDELEREKNKINYYVKYINAIDDELDDLIKKENVQKYLELSKSEEVREYIKLLDERDFLRASLSSYRNGLSNLNNNKSKSI